MYVKKAASAPGIKAICLNIAHDCNLSCDYCFADKGDYGTGRSLMSLNTAKRALEFLVENSGTRHNLEVDFFGGEPLMNFDVIRKTVEYKYELERIYDKKINCTITTNGTVMNDEIADFINAHMDNVVISIDGRKETHDRARHYPSGKGSYNTAVKNAKKVLDGRSPDKSHYIRGTFTNRNLDFTEDVMHLSALGFKEISVEPVIGRGEDFHLSENDIARIMDEYEALALKIKAARDDGGHVNFYHFNSNIYDGPCLYKRISACGAGYEYIAVAPGGKIYPCHQFVGEKKFEMGDVESGITNRNTVDLFRNSNIFTKEECANCWAKYYCSGGCHAESYYRHGSIYKQDMLSCELQKKRIECAIYLDICREAV